MEDPFVLILLVSMLLAAISVAVLWYWWSGGDEGEIEESVEDDTPPVQAEAPASPESTFEPGEPTIGDFLGRLRQSASSLLSGEPGTSSVPVYPAQATSPPAASSTVTSGGAIEVMRVLRDLADGSLLVEMDGQRYRNLNHIADPQVRRRFLGNAQALAQFAQLSEVDGMLDWPEISPETPPVSPTPVEELPATPPVTPEPEAVPPPPAAPPPPIASSERPSFETESRPKRRGLFGLGGSKEDEEVEEPKSMAEEIEELLQYRLTLNPDLVHRSIHIRPAHHGVMIEVDGQSFDGVGEVDDDTIRDFIQSVIQEWEARQ